MKTMILSLSLISGTAAIAQDVPKLGQVNISDFIYGGSGCPQGTVTHIVTNSEPNTNNADYFQITYDDFSIWSGPKTKSRDRDKTCGISFHVTYPKGYKFSLNTMEMDGYADISDDLFARFRTFAEVPLGKFTKYEKYLVGPFEGDINEGNTSESLPTKFTGCDGFAVVSLDQNIMLGGNVSKEFGFVTSDQESGLLVHGVSLNWQKCD